MDKPILLHRRRTLSAGASISVYQISPKEFMVKCDDHGQSVTRPTHGKAMLVTTISHTWCTECETKAKERRRARMQEERKQIRPFDRCLNCAKGHMREEQIPKRITHRGIERIVNIDALKCSRCTECVVHEYALAKLEKIKQKFIEEINAAHEKRRLDREAQLKSIGFEELSDDEKREQLARNIAMLDWPKDDDLK